MTKTIRNRGLKLAGYYSVTEGQAEDVDYVDYH
jgi:hypothetical protein